MNEKIKKIALQAGGSHYPDVGGVTLEKFAQLLIKECAKYINERTQDWDADLRWIFNDGSGDMAVNVDELLNRHFGVEE